jgi:chromosome condensin MukBEF complex kleisin-like MukF subunit
MGLSNSQTVACCKYDIRGVIYNIENYNLNQDWKNIIELCDQLIAETTKLKELAEWKENEMLSIIREGE